MSESITKNSISLLLVGGTRHGMQVIVPKDPPQEHYFNDGECYELWRLKLPNGERIGQRYYRVRMCWKKDE